MLTFRFSGSGGLMTEPEILTSGMVGKQMVLELSPEWEHLAKTVVFSNGETTVDQVCTGKIVTIPAKVLEKSLRTLTVGIYGVSSDGKLVIPTIRAEGPKILPGVDPAGDRTADPELPLWAQLQGIIGPLEQLETENRESLVAAINEAAKHAGEGGTRTDGATFVPAVSADGTLSWTNDGGLANPPAVNLKGTAGKSAYAYAKEGGYTGSEAAFAEKLAQEMPTVLPNPQSLTFTGGVQGVYDGSQAVTLAIPVGSSGGGSSGAWELVLETVFSTEVSWMEFKTFDVTRGEYLVAILVPQVETQVNAAYSRLFGQRGIRTHSMFASPAGKMLHVMYAKKIGENEALYIGYEAEKSEGFQDVWSRTCKTTILYGGCTPEEGLNISNTIPVGTHIKIYAK